MHYKPKHKLKVVGNMSEKGSDEVGRLLGVSAVILAFGAASVLLLYGISLIKWW